MIEKKNFKVIFAVIILLIVTGGGTWYFLHAPATDTGKSESITIGVPPVEQSALILIADNQDFFAANGLNVTIRNYTMALDAINGMERGEVDFSESSEYPIVTEAFNGENISIIGSIDKHQTVYLVGRRDHGIENITDLRGRRSVYTKEQSPNFTPVCSSLCMESAYRMYS